MIHGLVFGGRNVADRFEQAPVVEPINPLERGVFDVIDTAPWTAAMNDLSLVQADHGKSR